MNRFNFLKIFSFVALVGVLVIGVSAGKAFAVTGVSSKLSYQGRLTDINGNPLGGTPTTYCMRFSIWNVATGGTANPNQLWPAAYATPTSNSVTVTNGVFNVGIGDADTLGFDFSTNDTVYLNVEVNQTATTCGGTWDSLTPRQRVDATAYARVAANVYGTQLKTDSTNNRVQIGVGGAGSGSPTILFPDSKNTSDTVGGACGSGAYLNGAIWYNSNIGRMLTCSSNVIQVSGNAISNQFFDVTGPTAAIKTFTFPDANATVLTSNTAVTALQGGTGQAGGYTIGDLLYASGASALSKLVDVTAGSYLRSGGAGAAPVWSTVTLPNTVTTGDLLYASATNVLSVLAKGTANKVLSMDGTGTNVTWATVSGGSNALLDGSTHTDTTAGTVARGDVMTGQTATPKWTRLAKGTANQVLSMDATATDVVWATPAGGGGSPGGADTQVQFNNAGAFGGGAGLTWNNTTNDLTLGGVDTGIIMKAITNEPTAPAAGNLHLYAKSVAGRMMPKWKAPSGVDTSFQSSLGFNTIQLWTPSLTSTGAGFGTVWPAGTGTFLSVVPTATTAGQLRRSRFTNVVTTTNQILGITASTAAQIPSFWRGSTAGNGGFFFQTRFTTELVPATTVRLFVGLTSLTTGVAAANTVTLDVAGLSHITTDGLTTMAFMTRDNVTTTRATFTVPTIASGNAYDFTMYAKPNDTVIYYRLVDLLTGNILVDSSTSTTLPRNTIFMGPQVQMSNGTANIVVTTTAIGINKIYIESDN